VVGDSCLILDVEIKLLQVCGPILMVVIMKFSLCSHELQRLMINVDNCLLPENVMPPLEVSFHNGVHFFVVIRLLMDGI
jgi:hypothetical protein